MKVIEYFLDKMSCVQFARHVSGNVNQFGAGVMNWIYFWFHFSICPFCRRYWFELRKIRKSQRAAVNAKMPEKDELDKMKIRIYERLKRLH